MFKLKKNNLVPIICSVFIALVLFLGIVTDLYQTSAIQIITILLTIVAVLVLSIYSIYYYGGKEVKKLGLKTKPAFIYIIGVTSVLSVIFSIFNLWFKIDTTGWFNALLLIFLGIGLMLEGKINSVIRLQFQNNNKFIMEFATAFLGIAVTVLGIIILPIFLIPITGTLLWLVIFAFVFVLFGTIVEMVY